MDRVVGAGGAPSSALLRIPPDLTLDMELNLTSVVCSLLSSLVSLLNFGCTLRTLLLYESFCGNVTRPCDYGKYYEMESTFEEN